jgi:hypothetical protein
MLKYGMGSLSKNYLAFIVFNMRKDKFQYLPSSDSHHSSEANDDMVADFRLCCVNAKIHVNEQGV